MAGVGDVNVDGYADLLLADMWANSSAGVAYLVLGSGTPASASISSAILLSGEVTTETPQQYLAGYAVSGAGDVNGDAFADFVIGAPYYSDGGIQTGAAYLVLGCAEPTSTDLSTAVRYIGPAESSARYFGSLVADAGDVDGDGFDDLLLASGHENAEVYLILGTPAPSSSADLSSEVQYTEGDFGDFSGNEVSGGGDVDADGYTDILIGARANDDGGSNAGAAYLVLGAAVPHSASLSSAIEYSGVAAGDYAGSVASAGDVDADGHADFLVGAMLADGDVADAGAAYLVLGSPAPASQSLSDVVKYSGEAANDAVGRYLSGAGDVDANGYDDLLIGAYGNDDGGENAGAVYLVLGTGL